MENTNKRSRILFLTDIHYHVHQADNDEASVNQYGYTGNERMQIMVDAVLAEHRKKPLDMVLILGDLGGNNYTIRPYMENGVMSDAAADAYFGSDGDAIYAVRHRYLASIEAAGIPVYCLPGNHDAYSNALWERLFGYARDSVIELPDVDTAILMLDLYGLEPTNAYFTANRETLSVRSARTEEEKARLSAIMEKAKNYSRVIACAHYANFDPDTREALASCENLAYCFVGDGHDITKVESKDFPLLPIYMLGKFGYSIREDMKVHNGKGTKYVYVNESGDTPVYLKALAVDTRSHDCRDYRFRPATEAELAAIDIPKVAVIDKDEALSHFVWNYAIMELGKEKDEARMDIVFPEVTYHGISKRTGHLLTPHRGMFPSVLGDWHKPYTVECLFDEKK